ncbi:MAG: hypothetical protein HC867_02275 [Bacteroidia bacterium]|nr:hypothetical protein [Bacteroidia bacterium]
MNFGYTFDRNQLNLSIQEAFLEIPEQAQTPIVMFTGNFAYRLQPIPHAERIERVLHILGQWSVDLETYRQVVDQFLLVESPAVGVSATAD